MKVNAAFIFIAPEVDYKNHRSVIDYSEAETVAQELVEQGVKAIELCAGFGNEGIARICKATKGMASVGAVKFDYHPGFDFKSGDELFQ